MYENEPLGDFELPAVRIVVSGDQPIVRAGLRHLVESDRTMAVVCEIPNCPAALAEAAAASPDLFLIDLDLTTRGFEALERLGALLDAANGVPVLILTGTDDPEATQYALHHGAIGLVSKQRPPEALIKAIRAGVAGEMCLEQSTMSALFRTVPWQSDNGDGLTARERDIVGLVGRGLHNKAIAKRLHISDTTVRHHLTSIFEKLEVSNRLELMRYMFVGEASEIEEPTASR